MAFCKRCTHWESAHGVLNVTSESCLKTEAKYAIIKYETISHFARMKN